MTHHTGTEKGASTSKASEEQQDQTIIRDHSLLAVRFIIREELHNLQFLGFKEKDILSTLESAKDDTLEGYDWHSDDVGIVLQYKKLLSEHIENRFGKVA